MVVFNLEFSKNKNSKMARQKSSYRSSKSSPKRRSSVGAKRLVSKKKNRLLIPYPILGFTLLLIGVLLIGLTFKSQAADGYKVTAKVPAPLPTTPAVILSPANGQHFKTGLQTVSGTCPTDNYPGNYVGIYRNNILSGTVLCGADNKFEVPVSLILGANELRAQIFNVTDDAGPPGLSVTVYFDPANATVPQDAQSLTIPPLLLKTDFKYLAYFVGQKVSWEMQIDGGEPSYAIKVEWGDGENSLVSRRNAGKFTIEHIYARPGSDPDNVYLIKVSAVDSGNREAYIQFFVRINPFNSPVGGSTNNKTSATSNPTSSAISRQLLAVAWPAYGITALMVISFWFGEQEELFSLRKKGAIKKRYG